MDHSPLSLVITTVLRMWRRSPTPYTHHCPWYMAYFPHPILTHNCPWYVAYFPNLYSLTTVFRIWRSSPTPYIPASLRAHLPLSLVCGVVPPPHTHSPLSLVYGVVLQPHIPPPVVEHKCGVSLVHWQPSPSVQQCSWSENNDQGAVKWIKYLSNSLLLFFENYF